MLTNYLIVGALLFALGTAGFLSRRNMIVMFLAVEMMLQGIGLNLVAFSHAWSDWNGQILTIFILTVAAAEAAVALALILALYRRRDSLDISLWQDLREPGQPPIADPPEAADVAPESVPEWPRLTPAGIEPKHREHPKTEELHVR